MALCATIAVAGAGGCTGPGFAVARSAPGPADVMVGAVSAPRAAVAPVEQPTAERACSDPVDPAPTAGRIATIGEPCIVVLEGKAPAETRIVAASRMIDMLQYDAAWAERDAERARRMVRTHLVREVPVGSCGRVVQAGRGLSQVQLQNDRHSLVWIHSARVRLRLDR